MKKIVLLTCFTGILNLSKSVLAQSNDCSAASPLLTVGNSCTPTAGSTAGFTDSGVGCNSGNEGDDGWYRFVATGTSQQINVTSTSGDDVVMELMTTCAAAGSTGCIDNYSGTNETSEISGLTIGTTYFLKIHTFANGSGTFNTCIVNVPANDECAGATAIVVGAPVVGSTAGADQDYTWLGEPCTNTGEVWYQFTTPAVVNCYSFWYDQVSNGCNAVSIWEGACPTGAYTDNQVNFSTNNFNDQGSNESELAGMLPNTTYYISVSNDIETNFTLNIRANTPLAANDQCSSAVGIGTAVTTADNAVAGCEYSYVPAQDGGLQSTDPSGCNTAGEFPCSSATGFGPAAICALTLENISWYNFTAAANGNITINFNNMECNNGGGGFQTGLFQGACGSLTATGACVAAASGSVTYTIPGAVAGASYYIAMDGNAGSNCHFTVSGTNVTPLPIELGSFNATLENNSVKLNWNTFSERNNNYFTIDKSKNGKDWEFVAQVKGSGNSSVEKIYSVSDNDPYEGSTYYRLTQTDFNGKTSESSFDDVYVKRTEKLRINIFPNPSSESNKAIVNVYNPYSKETTIDVYEINGKLVDSKIITTQEFNTKLEMKHTFKPGVYFVKASNEAGEIDTFKWIVE